MSWIDDVMDLLCRLYKDLGGDCKDLYSNPSQAPSKVVSLYGTNGPPTFPNSQARLDFLANLDGIEKQLQSGSNSFSDDDNSALNALIADLRKDFE